MKARIFLLSGLAGAWLLAACSAPETPAAHRPATAAVRPPAIPAIATPNAAACYAFCGKTSA